MSESAFATRTRAHAIGITTGAPTVVEGIPAGVEVTVVENRAELPARIAWTGVAWSSTDEGAELSPDGARVVLTLAGEGGSTVSVTATNSFEVLALTGSEGGPWLLAIGAGAMVLIGGGALALIRRRMAAGTE